MQTGWKPHHPPAPARIGRKPSLIQAVGVEGGDFGRDSRYLPRKKTSVQWFDFAFVTNPRTRHDWREVAHVSGASLDLRHLLLKREFGDWPDGQVAVHCAALTTLLP